jgi:hypothetical protein
MVLLVGMQSPVFAESLSTRLETPPAVRSKALAPRSFFVPDTVESVPPAFLDRTRRTVRSKAVPVLRQVFKWSGMSLFVTAINPFISLPLVSAYFMFKKPLNRIFPGTFRAVRKTVKWTAVAGILAASMFVMTYHHLNYFTFDQNFVSFRTHVRDSLKISSPHGTSKNEEFRRIYDSMRNASREAYNHFRFKFGNLTEFIRSMSEVQYVKNATRLVLPFFMPPQNRGMASAFTRETIRFFKMIRNLPESLRLQIEQESAKTGIPREVYVAILAKTVYSSYSIEKGVSIYSTRTGLDFSAFTRLLGMVKNLELDPKALDLVSGIFLEGKNTMGIYQIRPETVEKELAGETLGGEPVDELADHKRRLAFLLLRPEVSLEAISKLVTARIDTVKNWIEQAKKEGVAPDFSEFEAQRNLQYNRVTGMAPTAENFQSLPAELADSWDTAWMLLEYDPLYRDKLGISMSLYRQVAFALRTMDRPESTSFHFDFDNLLPEDLPLVERLRTDDDPVVRDAAAEAFEYLIRNTLSSDPVEKRLLAVAG